MSKKNDWISLGEAYKDVFKKVVIKEGVPEGEIGDAPLEDGGPTERGGFKESEIDVTKMSEKENKYNVKGYSYGNDNDPGLSEDEPEPTGPTFGQTPYSGIIGNEEDEEDKSKKKKTKRKKAKKFEAEEDKEDCENEEAEENLGETEKIARESLNNFMAKKSVFDRLYDKVMVNENFPEMEEIGDEDLDALGLDDVETDDELDEEITITIDRDTATKLHELLGAAIGDGDGDEVEGIDLEVGVDEVESEERFRFPAEDEEAAMKDGGGYSVDAGSTLKKEINYGKKNKVGKLRPATGLAQKDGGGYSQDAGSTLSQEVDYGKQNKVGNLKPGPLPGA